MNHKDGYTEARITPSMYAEIINECDRFAGKEVLPGALEADLAGDQQAARRLWEKSRQMDLPGLLVPEAFGGVGLNLMSAGLVLDRLAAACAGFASVFVHHFAACAAAVAAGPDGAEKWFSTLAGTDGNNPVITSVCLPPEPAENRLFVTTANNNQMVVNGRSPILGSAGLAGAMMVFAARDDNPDDLVAVRLDAAAPGVCLETPLSLPGLKMNVFAALTADNAPIKADDVLAEDTDAKNMIRAATQAFYGFVGATAMGCSRRAFGLAKVYAGQRYQFKKTIIHHQEIQRLLGNMQMKLNLGTAGWVDLLDDGKWRPSFHAPDAALVKAFCTDAALEIVLDAIQIHGGYGYMNEYGLEKAMRDVKVLQVLGQTNPCLLVRHIADQR